MILPLVLALAQIQQANQPAQIPPATTTADILKAGCPQYQHDIGFSGVHNCRPVGKEDTFLMQCDPDPPQCVDDIRMLSERDWQALMKRIEKLEADSGKIKPQPEGVLGDYIKPWMNGAGAGDVETFDPSIPHDVSREGYHPSKDNPGCLESPSSDILICPDAADKPRVFVRDNVKIITHEPYDGAGIAFLPHPRFGETYTITSKGTFKWDGQAWKFIPPAHLSGFNGNPGPAQHTEIPCGASSPCGEWKSPDTGRDNCPDPDQHYHPANMPVGAPDIYGGPAPVADGKCHYNLSDRAVITSRKKLEAKR